MAVTVTATVTVTVTTGSLAADRDAIPTGEKGTHTPHLRACCQNESITRVQRLMLTSLSHVMARRAREILQANMRDQTRALWCGVIATTIAVAAVADAASSASMAPARAGVRGATTAVDPHRPVYHITPDAGHLNDANGMFYDPQHGRYHLFHQYTFNVAGTPPHYWYHHVSADLAHWTRLGVPPAGNLSACSGGAALSPDRTPTLFLCSGPTATPANRSDPDLVEWVTSPVDPSAPAFWPADIPGKWDGSCTSYVDAASGVTRYRLTFGSCTMLPLGRERPHQANGYCDGTKQDGLPQILQYESTDLATFRYLGVPWNGTHADWGPRIECPYEVLGLKPNRSVLVLSAPGLGQDFFEVGFSPPGNNGSTFTPLRTPGGATRALIDHGPAWYAGAVMQTPAVAARGPGSGVAPGSGVVMPRPVLFGWLRETCDTSKAVPPRTWISALSLPRVLSLADDDTVEQDVAPETVALRAGQGTVVRNLTLSPRACTPVTMPAGAAGDALEVRVNWTAAPTTPPAGVVLVLRSTLDRVESTNVSFVPGESGALAVQSRSLAAGVPAGNSTSTPLLAADGRYSLRVFVDHSVVEAFVNARRSIVERTYPAAPADAVHAWISAAGDMAVEIDSVEVWCMTSIWD